MSLGAKIRKSFGPYERPISNLYRAFFINLKQLVNHISKNHNPVAILEIGCGEGAMTEILVQEFPEATITGIDISPKAGRLFQGNPERVEFKQITIQDFEKSTNQKFDLILICDVLHHVPWDQHDELLDTAKKLLSGNGILILKDWEKRNNPINYFSYLMERYVTGDKAKYKTEVQWIETIIGVFGKHAHYPQVRIGPWKNNIMFLIEL